MTRGQDTADGMVKRGAKMPVPVDEQESIRW